MNKSYLVIGTVVVVFLLGVYFIKYQKPTGTQPSISPTTFQSPSPETGIIEKATVTVKYTETGFDPKAVTIKKGETVEWVNESDNPMWVASSPHPQHTDYPGFDELKGDAKGETYSFSFDKTGMWKYHNHLGPKDFGSVTVQE
jgi:plastocyanin